MVAVSLKNIPESVAQAGAAAAEALALVDKGYVEIEPNTPVALPPVTLEPADGRVRVQSEPPGATLLVDGRFRGRTPVAVDLEPGRSFKLTVSQAGFRDAEKTIRLKSGEDRRERFQLEEITGVVLLNVQPPDALVSVDGKPPVPVPSSTKFVASVFRK